jgi:hypothetical protein
LRPRTVSCGSGWNSGVILQVQLPKRGGY